MVNRKTGSTHKAKVLSLLRFNAQDGHLFDKTVPKQDLKENPNFIPENSVKISEVLQNTASRYSEALQKHARVAEAKLMEKGSSAVKDHAVVSRTLLITHF